MCPQCLCGSILRMASSYEVFTPPHGVPIKAWMRTSLNARDLPDDLHALRTVIERAVPHGRTDNGGRNDRGAWRQPPPRNAEAM